MIWLWLMVALLFGLTIMLACIIQVQAKDILHLKGDHSLVHGKLHELEYAVEEMSADYERYVANAGKGVRRNVQC